jgi:hypothetical protein
MELVANGRIVETTPDPLTHPRSEVCSVLPRLGLTV